MEYRQLDKLFAEKDFCEYVENSIREWSSTIAQRLRDFDQRTSAIQGKIRYLESKSKLFETSKAKIEHEIERVKGELKELSPKKTFESLQKALS